jgi:hypothetical protein
VWRGIENEQIANPLKEASQGKIASDHRCQDIQRPLKNRWIKKVLEILSCDRRRKNNFDKTTICNALLSVVARCWHRDDLRDAEEVDACCSP